MVVVGGSFAGRRVERLLRASGNFAVTLVDAKGFWEYYPAACRALVEPSAAARIVKPQVALAASYPTGPSLRPYPSGDEVVRRVWKAATSNSKANSTQRRQQDWLLKFLQGGRAPYSCACGEGEPKPDPWRSRSAWWWARWRRWRRPWGTWRAAPWRARCGCAAA